MYDHECAMCLQILLQNGGFSHAKQTTIKYFKYDFQMKDSITLDALDLRILAHLQIDSSCSNQDLAVQVLATPATCFRRVNRLRETGLIEREVALLNPERLAALIGHGLSAIVEVSLEVQNTTTQDSFEARAVAHASVQQCYRTSPGPDFVLIVQVRDMPAYLLLAQVLFAADANVRNVRAFFSVKRVKFEPAIALV